MVDDQHPAGQSRDVAHVVAGQQHGGPALLVVAAQERAQRGLAADVEAERRLVEEEHLRPVQEGGRELAPHPLARG